MISSFCFISPFTNCRSSVAFLSSSSTEACNFSAFSFSLDNSKVRSSIFSLAFLSYLLSDKQSSSLICKVSFVSANYFYNLLTLSIFSSRWAVVELTSSYSFSSLFYRMEILERWYSICYLSSLISLFFVASFLEDYSLTAYS